RAWLLEEEALVDLDEATLAAITPNLVLYVGYRGRFPYAIAIALTLIFLFSGVAAAGFAAGLARLLLTRRYRGYTDPQTFGSALILTSDKVLLTRAFGERELNRSELSRVFPRTKRMEGGRLRWSIVFMVGATGKREFIAWLDSESQVQEVLAKFNADE
ncbi:MAG: hypothetical protein LBC65_02170, partial [Oscillospiraceae bacterium]|nr:hypothetical protein [Oscillospiraceae bacterium]